jgi:hypothetical protein
MKYLSSLVRGSRPIVLATAYLLVLSCGFLSSERSQTSKLLGVKVVDFPGPQRLTEYDPVPPNPPAFEFDLDASTIELKTPRDSFETRPSVFATAPDGSIWEAYCGEAGAAPNVMPEIDYRSEGEKNQPKFVEAPPGNKSGSENTRQGYATHLGYGYQGSDVFIGVREDDRLKTKLFFRDVGSHTTAPHHFSIDSAGRAHLVVIDVNISDDNQMDLYWMVGDLSSGKWLSATLIEQRGFTSVSHPWTGISGNKVHLIWSWSAGARKSNADGLYYLERAGEEFGRKSQFVSGDVWSWDAAVDPESGRILVVYSTLEPQALYAVTRSPSGEWTRPESLPSGILEVSAVKVAAAGDDEFVIRIGDEVRSFRALQAR